MDRSLLIDVLKNCYRKFKANVCCSSNLEYLKEIIFDFESDETKMDNTFELLADNFAQENKPYFYSLAKNIKIIPFIKTIKESEASNNKSIISNQIDDSKICVSKVNCFIKMPVELFILDVFWSLVIGLILNESSIAHNCYANILSDKVLLSSGPSIIKSINFNNLSIYKHYFAQYLKWKNDAIRKAKELHKSSDLTIFSLDISRYFYNTNIDFDELKKYLIKKNKDYQNYIFLHDIIVYLYYKGNEKLSELDYSTKNKNTLLIGLVSSTILCNYYLRKIDGLFMENKSVKYYGRYVDDILIVIDKVDFNNFEDLIKKHLSNEVKKNNEEYFLLGFYDLKIQKEKTTIIKIYKNSSDVILNKLIKEIHPSEPRLFPSYGKSMKDFLNDINAAEETIKFRDASTPKLDVKKLVTAINGYLGLHKNTEISSKVKKNEFKKTNIEELMLLLNTKNLLTLFSRWNKIFLFVWLYKDRNNTADTLLRQINKSIKSIKLELDNEINFNKNKISKILINELKFYKKLAHASAIAISGWTKKIEKGNGKKEIIDMATKLRKANLIDYNAISYPLVNYLDSNLIDSSVNLFNVSFSARKKFSSYDLNERKILYSPRFIHLHDYLFFKSYNSFNHDVFNIDYDLLINEYKNKINKVFGFVDVSIKTSITASQNNEYQLITFNIEDSSFKNNSENNIHIGLANINLDTIRDKYINNKTKRFNNKVLFYSKEKESFRELLNSCFIQSPKNDDYVFPNEKNRNEIKKREVKNIPVSYITFPEIYLPFEWIPDLIKYCKNTGTVVITGIRYVLDEKKVYNLQAVIVPFRNSNYYKQVGLFIREKNNYAPFEKEAIIKSGKICSDHKNSMYFGFKFRNTLFNTFICYEMTDIYARALVRNKTEIVFASEYNFDIVYFSNIAESTARDLSCYVVQVNSSSAGDTRIIAPYKDKFKNIASIKGGVKNYIHIGTINLNELKEFLKKYSIADKEGNYKVMDEYNKMKKPSARTKRVRVSK